MAVRVIPILTLINNGLYRTVSFKKPQYIGDPLNALKIFNDKGADELAIIDIAPHKELTDDRIEFLASLSSHAFMPTSYGGNIDNLPIARKIFRSGFEKIVVNSAFFKNPLFIKEISQEFGAQSIVVSIDTNNNFWGKESIYINRGNKRISMTPREAAKLAEENGAGEIYIRSIAHDGRMNGYDCQLIKKVSDSVSIPVVALGGAGTLEHMALALKSGAHAVAAGSMFVYQGRRRGVLINYPDRTAMQKLDLK